MRDSASSSDYPYLKGHAFLRFVEHEVPLCFPEWSFISGLDVTRGLPFRDEANPQIRISVHRFLFIRHLLNPSLTDYSPPTTLMSPPITREIFYGTLVNSSAPESGEASIGWILKCGGLEEVADLMETLSGLHLSIEDVVVPIEVIRNCVNKRNAHAAIRYAGFCTHSDEIFCNAILEFGKRGDMASALTVFEASKQNLGCVNMYAYRKIIDVCGLCCDHLQSGFIYEVDTFAQFGVVFLLFALGLEFSMRKVSLFLIGVFLELVVSEAGDWSSFSVGLHIIRSTSPQQTKRYRLKKPIAPCRARDTRSFILNSISSIEL
ncbi:hypothetical protein L2E82_15651 [Cichorium intybus]|uniref:Uncharacterized protein n=1 Tax=Cichorium intybus TaxID=13427 RepID=A0ACB9F4N4_CICIN|nr:hypothetical protein L2E82_15651 [Cichorium intybus]